MEPLSPVVELLVIGAIAGYFTGFLVKKVLGLALTLGIFSFLFMYLGYTDVIDLNLEELGATINRYADALLDRLGLATLLSTTPFVGSYVIGLVLGLMKG